MTYSSEFVSKDYLHLNHCGVQYLQDKDYILERPNGRTDYHILYIHQGACHAELLGKPTIAREGTLILFKPGEKHKYRFYKSDLPISCYLHFTGNGCEKLLNELGFNENRTLYIGVSKTMLSVFEKLEMERNLKQPFFNQMCVGYMLELFSIAGRRYAYNSASTPQKNTFRIGTVCQFMYDNYARSISVDECAKQCALSPGRFAHIFKESTGKTPIEYINAIRISKAKELLLLPNYSMSEIAEMVGYPNQNYFSRVFKKSTGFSPKQYAHNIK